MALNTLSRKVLLALLLSGLLSPAWSGESTDDLWEVSAHGSLFLYAAHGETVHGHQFGFLKNAGHCDQDMLYITWSTSESKVSELQGVEATINFNLDGERFQLELPLLRTFEFHPGVLSRLIFSNFPASDGFIELLKRGQSIEVAINSPSELRQLMDVQMDSFNLEGLADARSEAMRTCISGRVSG